MNILEFSTLVWLGAIAAGFLGALTGLGGVIVVIPMLTLLFAVDIRYAAGAALISVIVSVGKQRSGRCAWVPPCSASSTR